MTTAAWDMGIDVVVERLGGRRVGVRAWGTEDQLRVFRIYLARVDDRLVADERAQVSVIARALAVISAVVARS